MKKTTINLPGSVFGHVLERQCGNNRSEVIATDLRTFWAMIEETERDELKRQISKKQIRIICELLDANGFADNGREMLHQVSIFAMVQPKYRRTFAGGTRKPEKQNEPRTEEEQIATDVVQWLNLLETVALLDFVRRACHAGLDTPGLFDDFPDKSQYPENVPDDAEVERIHDGRKPVKNIIPRGLGTKKKK